MGETVEFAGNRRTMKKLILKLKNYGWLMDKNRTSKSGTQTGCTAHFVRCLHLETELTAGRWAVPDVEQTVHTLPLLDINPT